MIWSDIQNTAAATAAKSLQSCPTLCDPIDGSPPGSSIPRILQARTFKWVAISFSNAWKWKVKVKSLSRIRLLATPWTEASQAPPFMGFSRQEYWSGVPLPSPCMSLYLIKRKQNSFWTGALFVSWVWQSLSSSVIALLNIRDSTLKRKLSSVKTIWIHCVLSLVTHQRTHSGEHHYEYSEWGNAFIWKPEFITRKPINIKMWEDLHLKTLSYTLENPYWNKTLCISYIHYFVWICI